MPIRIPSKHRPVELCVFKPPQVTRNDLDLHSGQNQSQSPVYNSLSIPSPPPGLSVPPPARQASLLQDGFSDEPLFPPGSVFPPKCHRSRILLLSGGVFSILVGIGLTSFFLTSGSNVTFDNTSVALDLNETENPMVVAMLQNDLDSTTSKIALVLFPIPDLRTRLQQNFKVMLLGLNSSITADNGSLAESLYLGTIPMANATIVTEAISAGTEALIARRKTEERLSKLGLGLAKASTKSRGGAGGREGTMKDAEQIHQLSLIGFSMEKASRLIAKRLNLTKAEAEEGIVLDPMAKLEPTAWCASQMSHVLDRNCNLTREFRTVSGRCNNLNRANWGMRLEQYRRILRPDYDDGISSPRKSLDQRPLPNALRIVQTLLKDWHLNFSTVSYMFPLWAEFIERDMDNPVLSSGENGSEINCCEIDNLLEIQHPECFPIYANPEDDKTGQHCVSVVRSAAAPTCSFGTREQFNLNTAFIDGSTIYGDLGANQRISERDVGTIEHDGSLNVFWIEQHNRIAAELGLINGHWKAERVFEETKKIVIGLIQHITVNEYLPVLLGPKMLLRAGLDVTVDTYYEGYDKGVDPGISNVFSSTASKFRIFFNLGSTLETNRSRMDFMGNPFLSPGFNLTSADLLVRDLAFTRIGTDADASSLNISIPQNSSESNNATHKTTNHFNRLAAIVIQRGRDHGIPAYTKWRKLCGLTELHNFSALNSIWAVEKISTVESVYKSLEDVDLYVGGMAEIVPEGTILGPTFQCLLADQFIRARKGDRYWYEGDISIKPFTSAQLASIRTVTLGSLLCSVFKTLGAIQRRVLQSVSETNPILPCNSILAANSLNFTAWKEDKPIPGIQMPLSVLA